MDESELHSHESATKKARLQGPVSETLSLTKFSDEEKAGLRCFVESFPKGVFTGLLKQRYSDFRVNEILLSGEILRFPKSSTTQIDKDDNDGNVNNIDESMEYNFPREIKEQDLSELCQKLGDDCAKRIGKLYTEIVTSMKKKKRARDFEKVHTCTIEDKATRTIVHTLIRKLGHGKLSSTTNAENVIVISMAGGAGFRGTAAKRSWNEKGGEYVHFTLYKENKDTMEICNFLSGQLRTSTKKIGFAGTKDRRAITVQRMSAHRIDLKRLEQVGQRLKCARIGDFEISDHGISLGDLKGNEFTITLRDCRINDIADTEQLRQFMNDGVKRLNESGFINYFGLQRFGTFAHKNPEIGMKLLRNEFSAAIELILAYDDHDISEYTKFTANNSSASTNRNRPNDRLSRAAALNLWHDNNGENADQVLALLPSRYCAERSLIKHLGFRDEKTNKLTQKRDYQGALGKLARNLLLMYIHSYQSWIWNEVSSKRWERYGSALLPGDLVFEKILEAGPNREITPEDGRCTPHRAEAPSTNPPPLIGSGSRDKSPDVINTLFDSEVNLVLPDDDAQSESFSLNSRKFGNPSTVKSSDHLIYDDVGEPIIHPATSQSVNLSIHLLTQKDIDSGKYSIFDVVLPLPGYNIMYPDNHVAGFYTDFMNSTEAGNLDPSSMRHSWRQLSLNGAYRHFIVRPQNLSYFIQSYSDPLQEIPISPPCSISPNHQYLAVTVQFSLDSSQYATVALRELFHRDSLNNPTYSG